MAEPSTQPVNLCSTGIFGLDHILGGGLPRHHFYLIQGDPGVGKTTLGLKFLLAGAAVNEKCLYISLSETKAELLTVARSHGWNLETISLVDLSALDAQIPTTSQSTLFHPADVELSQTIKLLCDRIDQEKPDRVILDSLSEVRLMAEHPMRYRRQILALKQFFAERGTTAVLIENMTSDASDLQVQSVAHGVIGLEHAANKFGAERRRLRVVKLRGVQFQGGKHDYVIERGGLTVFPRLIAAEHVTPFTSEVLSSDLPPLDRLLGGGLARGTSTLFIGPAGTNKTTLASQFSTAAALRGQRAAYYTFDETSRSVLERAQGLNIPMRKCVDDGTLTVTQIDPAELTPGEMAYNIRRAVQQGTRVIVLDSLNGYLNAMPEEDFLVMQLHELLTFLSNQGVVTIMILAQHGMLVNMIAPADVTYLADAVLMLRYFEAAGEVKKAVSVIKKRGGRHENTIRELAIRNDRIVIGEPLREFQGVLTGVPNFQGSHKSILAQNNESPDSPKPSFPG